MIFLSPFSHIIAKKLRLKGLHCPFLFPSTILKGLHRTFFVSPPLLKGLHWTFLFLSTLLNGLQWNFLFSSTILKGLHWTFLFPSTILKGLHCTFLFSTKIQKGLHWTNVFFDPNAGRDENTLIRVSEVARPLPHILTIAKPWPQRSIEQVLQLCNHKSKKATMRRTLNSAMRWT